MTGLVVKNLLDTQIVAVRDVACDGRCRHKSPEECSSATHLVFPYRGVYVRHLGRNDAVAEANQVLFFNKAESYRVSHPVEGGDACLSITVREDFLQELAPKEHLQDGDGVIFRGQRLRMPASPARSAAAARRRRGTARAPRSRRAAAAPPPATPAA